MSSILDQIPSLVYQGFKGKLRKGTLIQKSRSSTLNGLGDPVSTSPTEYPCEGFVDNYSDLFAGLNNIPSTDSKVSIFAKSLPTGVAPTKDDKVIMMGRSWQIRRVVTDPAQALWECQSFEVA